MKTYKVPVTWKMQGVAYIEAASEKEALHKIEVGMEALDVMYGEIIDWYEVDEDNIPDGGIEVEEE